MTAGTANIVSHGENDGRDSVLTFAVDMWNLSFPVPGDYSFRILVDGSERKRLPLSISQLGVGPMVATTRMDADRSASIPRRSAATGPARHERPDVDEAALVAARAADRVLAAARERGSARWTDYFEPVPDRLRDDAIRDLRATGAAHVRHSARRTPSATWLDRRRHGTAA